MKQVILPLLLTGLASLASCQSDQHTSEPFSVAATETKPVQRLVGTWVPWPISHGAEFSLLRINSDSTGTYTAYGDRGPNFRQEGDTIRYYFSEAPIKIQYRPHRTGQVLLIPNLEVQIWMQGARFDYKLDGDTLTEFDKMGNQGSFVRLHNQ